MTKPCGTASSSDSREELAERDDHADVGADRRDLVDDLARPGRACAPARPSASAAAFTGLGSAAPPRPRRRSGWVTTSAISWPASCSAASGRNGVVGGAEVDEPHRAPLRTVLGRWTGVAVRRRRCRSRRRRAAGPQLAQRLLADVGLEPVEQEHAVEVVDLVLDQAAQQLVALEHDLVAVEVDAAHGDELGRTISNVQPGHREAALVVLTLAGASRRSRG